MCPVECKYEYGYSKYTMQEKVVMLRSYAGIALI